MTVDVRCYKCRFFKAINQYRGWCHAEKKALRTNAVDFCKLFELNTQECKHSGRLGDREERREKDRV